MGASQSSDMQCPMPNQPFVPQNTNTTVENINIFTERMKKKQNRNTLKTNLVNTIPVPENIQKGKSTISESETPLPMFPPNQPPKPANETSNFVTETSNNVKPVTSTVVNENPSNVSEVKDEIKDEVKEENPEKTEEEKEKEEIRNIMKGGSKYLKSKKITNEYLREVLKKNKIKVTHKGKYLNRKQLVAKLKMIKL